MCDQIAACYAEYSWSLLEILSFKSDSVLSRLCIPIPISVRARQDDAGDLRGVGAFGEDSIGVQGNRTEGSGALD